MKLFSKQKDPHLGPLAAVEYRRYQPREISIASAPPSPPPPPLKSATVDDETRLHHSQQAPHPCVQLHAQQHLRFIRHWSSDELLGCDECCVIAEVAFVLVDSGKSKKAAPLAPIGC